MNELLSLPGPEEAIQELWGPLVQIVSALDFGTMRARKYFEADDKDKPPDKYLASHIARFQARKYLAEAGAAVEQEGGGFDMSSLALSGLLMRVGRYRIRIWKADDDEIPAPGQSEERKKFFQQMPLSNAVDGERVVNLIVAWDAGSPYSLASLEIACPIRGEESRDSVVYEWRTPLDLSLLRVVPVQPDEPDPNDDGDLEMGLKRKKAEEEGE